MQQQVDGERGYLNCARRCRKSLQVHAARTGEIFIASLLLILMSAMH